MVAPQAVYPPYRPATPAPVQNGGPMHGAPQPAAMAAPPRRGPVRRFMRSLWEFTLTSIAVGLFVASWALAIQGVVEDRQRRLLAGAAMTVFFTPLAVHRLTGSRGNLTFGLVGSIGATLLGWRIAGRGDGDPAIALAAVFGMQVLASFLMSWLTRRREPEQLPHNG